MKKDYIERIGKIKKEIAKLPQGSIFSKEIKGNIYYYHQWSENGEHRSEYIKENNLSSMSKLIEKRKQLEIELKLLKKGVDTNGTSIYWLMHKNKKVINLLINNDTGFIVGVGEIKNASLLPIGTVIDEKFNPKALLEWWMDRSIPLSRSGIRKFLSRLNINNTQILLLRCYGLSLSDQYWIKPHDENLEWEDINFFDNPFSDDVGEILFDVDLNKKDLNLSSPDNTSVGNLKKRWRISNGKRILIKGGSNPFRQEPINEVVASLIAEILHIPCVKYTLLFDKEYPYCQCDDFLNHDTDLISAYQINKVLIKNNNDSAYTHFVKCCEYLKIPNVIDYLNKMFVFDFIIANEDRHFNNFGFVRNIETLAFEQISPLFDNGGSFGFDKVVEDIGPFRNIESKPFKGDPIEQLKYVTSFDWLNKKQLLKIKDIIKNEFIKYESKYLSKERIEKIIYSASERIEYLLKNCN